MTGPLPGPPAVEHGGTAAPPRGEVRTARRWAMQWRAAASATVVAKARVAPRASSQASSQASWWAQVAVAQAVTARARAQQAAGSAAARRPRRRCPKRSEPARRRACGVAPWVAAPTEQARAARVRAQAAAARARAQQAVGGMAARRPRRRCSRPTSSGPARCRVCGAAERAVRWAVELAGPTRAADAAALKEWEPRSQASRGWSGRGRREG